MDTPSMKLQPNALQWRHNDHDSVSNHQPHGCLLIRSFGRRWKKTSKLRVTGFCAGNSPGPVNSPHKGPVTRKMFPFDHVIMENSFEEFAKSSETAQYNNKETSKLCITDPLLGESTENRYIPLTRG